MIPLASAQNNSGVRMAHRNRIIRIAFLPTMHLCLCALAAFPDGFGNWNGMLIFLLDLPLTFIREWLNLPLFTTVSLTVYGTLWWLFIGVVLSSLYDWFESKRTAKGAEY